MVHKAADEKMSKFRWIGNSVLSRDGILKTQGRLEFFSDLNLPHMLWGKALFSKFPHALIKRIETSKAERIPGVVAILTHKDVPFNKCGVMTPDMPVLCSDKVRFTGDAVALVAAEDRATSERAVQMIEVDYEPLPLIDDPVEAMKPDSPKIHYGGNILHQVHATYGDIESALREADILVENEYRTGRQMHVFLETESGVATIEKDGTILVRAGGQAPHRDQLQISRALGVPLDKVRVVSTPTGGAFGGKEEATVQIHLALLAQRTKRPVKMVWSREESCVAGVKRHPMIITMKTAATKDGTIIANKTRIVADTGAYASMGAAVLTAAVEYSTAPYHIPNFDTEGFCVYTNNSHSGAFRGFGAPQAQFALETQIDIIAEKLSMDRIVIRKKNALRMGDVGPFGLPLKCSSGLYETLEKLESSDLYRNKDLHKAVSRDQPWLRRGIGVTSVTKGFTYGVLPDFGAASIEITRDGRFIVGLGCPEVGQRNRTTYAQIAAETLNCNIDDIIIDSADTATCPDCGTSSASRTTYIGGNAIIATAQKVLDSILGKAASMLNEPKNSLFADNGVIKSNKDLKLSVTYATLGERMHRDGDITRAIAGYVGPRHEKPAPGVSVIPHMLYSFASALALVEVDTLTGQTKVLKFMISPDAGRIVNRMNFEAQVEGALLQGLGYALMEDTLVEEGVVRSNNYTTYMIPTASDAPEIEIDPVEIPEQTGPFGAKGLGELCLIPSAPAICNAIYDAVGARIFQIPATPERVFKAIHDQSRPIGP